MCHELAFKLFTIFLIKMNKITIQKIPIKKDHQKLRIIEINRTIELFQKCYIY